mmetsp:Transcript_31524/g.100027  ORF Transcript_31524/g.100027 Transcript_31524/m.100027 type:complete len:508 (-) Transcript_31524:1285-2808(-)
MATQMATVDGVPLTEADLQDGFSAEQIFEGPSANSITFQDLIMLPGGIDFSCEDVDLATKLTKRIDLKLPFCSSPMDSVTEDEMAIALALSGGIGFLHCHCSEEEQVEMVRRVKAYENGFISNPKTLGPDATLEDMDAAGYTGVLITEGGAAHGKLLGVMLKEYGDFESDRSSKLGGIMLPVDEVFTLRHPVTLDEAYAALKAEKVKYLPIVDDAGNVVSLTTRTDLVKNRDHPDATKRNGKLLVGAAVVPIEAERRRADALIAAGADVIVLDERNGDSAGQIEMLRYLKGKYPEVDVIAGNVATEYQTRRLLEAGADSIRVGMGAGSVALTQQIKATGRAQLSAVYRCKRMALSYGVPIIADGGVSSTGAAIKALTVGASVVMMGSLLAGVDESPGEFFFHDGKRLKHYHGLTSVDAINRHNAMLAGILPAGVSGAVVERGDMVTFAAYLAQSVKHGFQDVGEVNLPLLHERVLNGTVRFELRSRSAQREGGVHDLHGYTKTLFRA